MYNSEMVIGDTLLLLPAQSTAGGHTLWGLLYYWSTSFLLNYVVFNKRNYMHLLYYTDKNFYSKVHSV